MRRCPEVAADMVLENASGYAVRIGVILLSLAMVVFMLGRPELYPLWTVVLIGFLGAVAALSLFRYVTG